MSLTIPIMKLLDIGSSNQGCNGIHGRLLHIALRPLGSRSIDAAIVHIGGRSSGNELAYRAEQDLIVDLSADRLLERSGVQTSDHILFRTWSAIWTVAEFIHAVGCISTE